MEVTDVLQGRRQQPGGLQSMLTVSMAVHATLFAAIAFVPTQFLHRSPPPTIMTISLGGGGNGPENGGMTPEGGRPVQEVKPPDEPPRREPVRPPAPVKPEMTMPLQSVRATKAPPAPAVKQAPDDGPRSRTPVRGDKITPGSTPTDTGARGMGFGLTLGGGPGSGSSLDVKDFCCPEYVVTMVTMIRRAWNPNQGTTGNTLVKFTIFRDGSIRDAEVERSSGNPVLDNAALRAVLQTRTLPPLPEPFPNPTLPVHLNFQYQ